MLNAWYFIYSCYIVIQSDIRLSLSHIAGKKVSPSGKNSYFLLHRRNACFRSTAYKIDITCQQRKVILCRQNINNRNIVTKRKQELKKHKKPFYKLQPQLSSGEASSANKKFSIYSQTKVFLQHQKRNGQTKKLSLWSCFS